MQINRLFEIIYLLMDKKTVTAGELAKRFEVSTRTVYRDIETLSAAGIPVYMSKGKGGGISLMADFVLNKTVLTEQEKTDVLSSLKALRTVRKNEAETALEKLSALFGECNTDWVEIDFTAWTDSGQEAALWDSLKSAVIHQKIIQFDYSSSRGEHTKRTVEPLKLCFKGQAWYLYGFCRTREDFRFFKLTRIRKLDITEEAFHRKPPEQVFIRQSPQNEKCFRLVLKIDRKMAFRVYDEFPEVEVQKDGSFIAHMQYPEGPWLFPYIASYGEYCEVLEPASVRAEFHQRLQSMQNLYEKEE